MQILLYYVVQHFCCLLFTSFCLIVYFVLVDVAVEREVEGDLILGDMGSGVPFRAGSFDGVIRSVNLTVLNTAVAKPNVYCLPHTCG